VAVANRPGLIGSLLVGLMAAKTLAWAWDVPLVGVNHIHAHAYSPALDAEPMEYPAVAMVASGGHTSLYHARSAIELELLGSTTDDAAGEAFDKVAAILGLPYPGGPNVDKAARTGDAKAIHFPRALLKGQSLDFSFSGLKTAVLYHVQGVPGGRREKVQRGVAQPPPAVGEGASGAGHDLAPGAIKDRMAGAPELTSAQIADIAASFQAALVDTLRIKIRRAVTAVGAKSLIIGGGVAANSALRSMVQELGEKLRLQVRMPAMKYCGDNAAMIAGLAWHLFNAGQQDNLEVECTATVRK
jgi:N6-L-threonylcarbamoyladenine synthase